MAFDLLVLGHCLAGHGQSLEFSIDPASPESWSPADVLVPDVARPFTSSPRI